MARHSGAVKFKAFVTGYRKFTIDVQLEKENTDRQESKNEKRSKILVLYPFREKFPVISRFTRCFNLFVYYQVLTVTCIS